MFAEDNLMDFPVWLGRCGDGYQAAWAKLFKAHWTPLLSYVQGQLDRGGSADRALAEDITAKVICSLLDGFGGRLAKFDPSRGSFMLYLRQLARKALSRHWRSEARRVLYERAAAQAKSEGPTLTELEVAAALGELDGHLSARHIRFLEEHLGLAPDPGGTTSAVTARVLLHRIRQKLRPGA